MIRLLILLLVLILGCTQQKAVKPKSGQKVATTTHPSTVDGQVSKTNQEDSQQKTNVKNYYSNLLSPIQADTNEFHRYGEIVLRKDNAGLYQSLENDGRKNIERFPGIINEKDLRTNQVRSLTIYKSNNIVKQFQLKEMNPFLDNYDNLIWEYPNFEKYIISGDGQDKLIPNKYLTFYDFGETSLNGYTAITYFLVPVSRNTLLSWESISIIINPDGSIIHKYHENSDIIPGLISDDGKLFGYTYSVSPQNPGNLDRHTAFRVVDLEENKIVLELPGGGSATDTEYNLISRVRWSPRGSKPQSINVEFINLNEKKIFNHIFRKEDFKVAWEINKSWLGILNSYPFEIKTF